MYLLRDLAINRGRMLLTVSVSLIITAVVNIHTEKNVTKQSGGNYKTKDNNKITFLRRGLVYQRHPCKGALNCWEKRSSQREFKTWVKYLVYIDYMHILDINHTCLKDKGDTFWSRRKKTFTNNSFAAKCCQSNFVIHFIKQQSRIDMLSFTWKCHWSAAATIKSMVDIAAYQFNNSSIRILLVTKSQSTTINGWSRLLTIRTNNTAWSMGVMFPMYFCDTVSLLRMSTHSFRLNYVFNDLHVASVKSVIF